MTAMSSILSLSIADFGVATALVSSDAVPARGAKGVVVRENGTRDIAEARSATPLPPKARPPALRWEREATEDDLREAAACRELATKALGTFHELAAKYDLPTRGLKAHAFLGRKQLVVWHCPKGPLPDLRSFEGELRRKVRCTVELRAAGPRETAALLGGCGVCGRPLCCAMGCALPPPGNDVSPALPTSATGICQAPRCCHAGRD